MNPVHVAVEKNIRNAVYEKNEHKDRHIADKTIKHDD
jgi:hypothetical protein